MRKKYITLFWAEWRFKLCHFLLRLNC